MLMRRTQALASHPPAAPEAVAYLRWRHGSLFSAEAVLDGRGLAMQRPDPQTVAPRLQEVDVLSAPMCLIRAVKKPVYGVQSYHIVQVGS